MTYLSFPLVVCDVCGNADQREFHVITGTVDSMADGSTRWAVEITCERCGHQWERPLIGDTP